MSRTPRNRAAAAPAAEPLLPDHLEASEREHLAGMLAEREEDAQRARASDMAFRGYLRRLLLKYAVGPTGSILPTTGQIRRGPPPAAPGTVGQESSP